MRTNKLLILVAALAVALVALPAAAQAAPRDPDGDGISDRWEKRHKVKRANADTDRDGVDNRNEYVEGTKPRDRDSDNDGRSDGREDRDRDRPERRRPRGADPQPAPTMSRHQGTGADVASAAPRNSSVTPPSRAGIAASHARPPRRTLLRLEGTPTTAQTTPAGVTANRRSYIDRLLFLRRSDGAPRRCLARKRPHPEGCA